MSDRKIIYLDDAIDAVKCGALSAAMVYGRTDAGRTALAETVKAIKALPSAQPDFSCDGCQTPKHICGICMRNYPNITDHYCTGEWAERRADGHEREN